MLNYFAVTLLVTAMSGMLLGAAGYKSWLASKAMKKRRMPERWHLQARSLLSESDVLVWHWLQRVFFEYDVLVKIPLVRFMAPRSQAEGQLSHELLKGLYCSFTICATDGTVIGCLDVSGRREQKASVRQLKQDLFAECGLAYAVVRATSLPALDAVRSAFLGAVDLTDDEPVDGPIAGPPAVEPAISSTHTEPAPLEPAIIQTDGNTSVEVDMLAVAEARNKLRAKLDRGRKIRFTNFDPLATGGDAPPEGGGAPLPSHWDDSFIMSESGGKGEPPKA